jgi:hypothetical protein
MYPSEKKGMIFASDGKATTTTIPRTTYENTRMTQWTLCDATRRDAEVGY